MGDAVPTNYGCFLLEADGKSGQSDAKIYNFIFSASCASSIVYS